jgi:hypothetical protein
MSVADVVYPAIGIVLFALGAAAAYFGSRNG